LISRVDNALPADTPASRRFGPKLAEPALELSVDRHNSRPPPSFPPLLAAGRSQDYRNAPRMGIAPDFGGSPCHVIPARGSFDPSGSTALAPADRAHVRV